MPVGIGTPTREDRGDHRRRDQDADDARPAGRAAAASPARCRGLPAHRRADAGADAAPRAPTAPRCWCATARELEVKVRLGEPELVKEAGSRALGLRVIKDQRVGGHLHLGLHDRPGWSGWRATASSWRRWPSPIPIGGAAGARARWRARCPSWTCGTRRCWRWTSREAIRRARARRGGGAEVGQAGHQLRGRHLRSRVMGASAFATSAGFSGIGTAAPTSRSSVEPICDDAEGKKRNGSYWTSSRFAARAARRRAGGAGGGAPDGGQAGVAQDPDRRGAGDLLARRGARAAGAAGGRDVGRRGLAAEQLPGRARGDAGRVAAGRRSSTIRCCRAAPGSRPFDGEGLATPAPTCWSSDGRAADLPVRRLRGAQAGPAVDRLGGARASAAARTSATSNFILRPGRDAGRRAGAARPRRSTSPS